MKDGRITKRMEKTSTSMDEPASPPCFLCFLFRLRPDGRFVATGRRNRRFRDNGKVARGKRKVYLFLGGKEGRRMLFAGILVVDLVISRQDQFEEMMVCVCVIWK